MVRVLPFLATLATSVLMIGAGAQSAFAQSPAYRAVPATAITAAQTVVVGDTLWKCAPGGCTANAATSRPAIVCAQAAKKVGKLESFTVGTTPFDAEAMAKCNAKAKA